MKQGSGSWRIAELMSDTALTEAEAAEAVKPISTLLDRIFDCTWSFANEEKLTGISSNTKKIIEQSIVGSTCDKINWVSLSKSLNPCKPNWLTEHEFSEAKEEYSAKIIVCLTRKIATPLCRVIWCADLSDITSEKMDDADDFWADLTELLPNLITACVDRELNQDCDSGITEDIVDLLKYAIFRPILNYLSMRYFRLTEESERLLPLLKLIDQGVVPLGIAKPHHQDHVGWLVVIA